MTMSVAARERSRDHEFANKDLNSKREGSTFCFSYQLGYMSDFCYLNIYTIAGPVLLSG